MPIFEYVCPKCSHVFEKLILGGNQQAPPCPKCGSTQAEQKYSTFATASGAPRSSRAACAGTGG
ncbi:MAG: zinc ribbon domain-containing protein [Acidobacteriia bacterium]|nr:zinc ribbon domain-containing protein [Terriglobia bacterium]